MSDSDSSRSELLSLMMDILIIIMVITVNIPFLNALFLVIKYTMHKNETF